VLVNMHLSKLDQRRCVDALHVLTVLSVEGNRRNLREKPPILPKLVCAAPERSRRHRAQARREVVVTA